MTKHCISCKREIVANQPVCYICGSQQGFIRRHYKTALLAVLLICLTSAGSYFYVDKTIKDLETNRLKFNESINAESAKKLNDLQQQLDKANEQIELAKTSATQSSSLASDSKTKIGLAEKRAVKAQERATWLSKENRRFKAKVKELSDKLSALEKQTPITVENEDTNVNSEQNKQQIANDEQQKQALLAQISAQKLKLTQSWEQVDSSSPTPPSAQVLTERTQQMEEAIKDKLDQILLLDEKIKALKQETVK